MSSQCESPFDSIMNRISQVFPSPQPEDDDISLVSEPILSIGSPRSFLCSPKASRPSKDPANVPITRDATSCSKGSQPHLTGPFSSPRSNRAVEKDAVRLRWRKRQIDFGKATSGYANYVNLVPRSQRGPNHPKTPPLDLKISKKKWGYLCNQWRKALHLYDNVSEQ
ncbi:hypothetical protein P9112_000568 [Eukaryota sp. TZLM1-RC]